MNIALMGGAYVNAGDFLIEHRCKLLLENILDANVSVLKRDIAYDDKIDELNRYDAIIFGGGPLFQQSIYPDRIPFVKNLDDINVPVRILGGGWKGANGELQCIENYKFSREMLSYVKFVAKQHPLSTRDWQTNRMLKNNGIAKGIMTGCPAWYDLSMINLLKLNDKYKKLSIKDNIKIGVSDAAYPRNKQYFWKLIEIIRNKFPASEILIFFHRGLYSDDALQVRKLCNNDEKIKYFDMAGSDEKFSLYNECYFHIGFRVHAHIYNLSQGNVSVLINEDARGIGVNHALGIESISCCLHKRGYGSSKARMSNFVSALDNYLDFIIDSNYMQYTRAMYSIQETYKIMYSYIKNMF